MKRFFCVNSVKVKDMFRVMDSEIGRALRKVLERVATASRSRPSEFQSFQPRLVAVSKTKPLSLVKEAYENGQRHFGENYVQELLEKGYSSEAITNLNEIRWHFIGRLQRNKVGKVVAVPNLFMLETITSEKLAAAVDAAWGKLKKPHRLKVMVQVNTSAEENKQGCNPEDTTKLVSYVLQNCPNLDLVGLMTIGSFGHDLSSGPNPDFELLIKCKEEVCSSLGLDRASFELSMGMSNDFEHAIELGSANVRVGTTIFGARDYGTAAPQQNGPQASSSTNSANSGSENSDSAHGDSEIKELQEKLTGASIEDNKHSDTLEESK